MTATTHRPVRGRVHPAWAVAGVTFLALLGAAGFRSTPGVLMEPLQHEFGCRGQRGEPGGRPGRRDRPGDARADRAGDSGAGGAAGGAVAAVGRPHGAVLAAGQHLHDLVRPRWGWCSRTSSPRRTTTELGHYTVAWYGGGVLSVTAAVLALLVARRRIPVLIAAPPRLATEPPG